MKNAVTRVKFWCRKSRKSTIILTFLNKEMVNHNQCSQDNCALFKRPFKMEE